MSGYIKLQITDHNLQTDITVLNLNILRLYNYFLHTLYAVTTTKHMPNLQTDTCRNITDSINFFGAALFWNDLSVHRVKFN